MQIPGLTASWSSPLGEFQDRERPKKERERERETEREREREREKAKMAQGKVSKVVTWPPHVCPHRHLLINM